MEEKKKMVKRVSMDSHQSCGVDEEARFRLKHQILLQDYLELQKDFVSKKRKLQIAKQKGETLLAEVRFLRRRHMYFMKIKSPKVEPEKDLVQPQHSDVQTNMHARGRNYTVDEAALRNPYPVLDLSPNLVGDKDNGGRKEQLVLEPLSVNKKPKNCLINDKRMGKKKISWQDQVALEV